MKELKRNLYTSSAIIQDGIKYPSVPSATVSLLVFMNYYETDLKNKMKKTGSDPKRS